MLAVKSTLLGMVATLIDLVVNGTTCCFVRYFRTFSSNWRINSLLIAHLRPVVRYAWLTHDGSSYM